LRILSCYAIIKTEKKKSCLLEKMRDGKQIEGGVPVEFKAKMNLKFYILTVLLLGIVILGWYGVCMIQKNEVLMEDGTPMSSEMRSLFSVLIGVVVSSWTLSLLTLFRQILIGSAFSLDENGIHSTVTAVNVLAFIFVIPIRTIPYSAIREIKEEEGVTVLHLDKSLIEVSPFLKLFARKRYHLFAGFTKEKREAVKAQLDRYYQHHQTRTKSKI